MALLFSISVLNAQNSTDQEQADVQVGDVFEIGTPETHKYNHINFPRANFIIKRGGIADYKRAEGYKVVVTAVKEKKNGTKEVNIKRNDGGRFFGSHTVVAADFNKAVAAGELRVK